MKLRLALTSLGVVIGTSAIVLMISLGIGLEDNITQGIGDIGAANQIVVMPGGFSPIGEQAANPLHEKALEDFAGIEHVTAVVPTVYLQTLQGVRYKRQPGHLNAIGMPEDGPELLGYELESGRFPRNEKEILLGASATQDFERDPRNGKLLEPLDLLGRKLEVTFFKNMPAEEPSAETEGDPALGGESSEPSEYTRKITVVGVLAEHDMQTDTSAYVTLDAALEYNGMSTRRPEYEQVTLVVDSPASAADVEDQVRDQGFETMSARSIQNEMKKVFLIVQGVLGALGAIAMLVASLGIANTMTMSIFERTREIGIMKAVGASNRQIKRVFLGEAAIIGALGGVGGLLVSISGASLANLFVSSLVASQSASAGGGAPELRPFFQITLGLAGFAVLFAAGVGLLAGVLPAVRASNLDPLVALRHE